MNIIKDMNIKQVIIVRVDIKMSKGKIAAQVGHACVTNAENVRITHPEWFKQWLPEQKKIVLKIDNKIELDKIKKQAIKVGLPVCEINDAGLTQLEPNTTTCLALGPAPEINIDCITCKLKLL